MNKLINKIDFNNRKTQLVIILIGILGIIFMLNAVGLNDKPGKDGLTRQIKNDLFAKSSVDVDEIDISVDKEDGFAIKLPKGKLSKDELIKIQTDAHDKSKWLKKTYNIKDTNYDKIEITQDGNTIIKIEDGNVTKKIK